MAEEEFEIDVYGDSANDHGDHEHGDHNHGNEEQRDYKEEDRSYKQEEDGHDLNGDEQHDDYREDHREDTMDDAGDRRSLSPQRPQQGVKRKEGSDERPVDPGATTALMMSELNWWNTDDDVRGWVRQAGCEHELKDVSFSEHKVNGKSKG